MLPRDSAVWIVGLGATAVLSGCEAQCFCTQGGVQVHEFFPIQLVDSWVYEAEGGFGEEELNAVTGEGWRGSGVEVVPVEYTEGVGEPDEQATWTLDWSSDVVAGLQIHGFDIDGRSEAFDEPVAVAASGHEAGTTLATELGDEVVRSTYLGLEECIIPASDESWLCVHYQIEWSADGEVPAPPFVGDWWFAPSWGPVRMEVAASSLTWVFAEGTSEVGSTD